MVVHCNQLSYFAFAAKSNWRFPISSAVPIWVRKGMLVQLLSTWSVWPWVEYMSHFRRPSTPLIGEYLIQTHDISDILTTGTARIRIGSPFKWEKNLRLNTPFCICN